MYMKRALTSQPDAGGSPSQLGGGPPYFLCPVVTSSLYPVLLRISFIFSSSGPLATTPPLVLEPEVLPVRPPPLVVELEPPRDLALYVYMTPQRKADLLETWARLDSRNWVSTPNAPSGGNSFKASSALWSKSECDNLPKDIIVFILKLIRYVSGRVRNLRVGVQY